MLLSSRGAKTRAMKIPYFQVNAFTRELTGGNPAGVCLLKKWPSSMKMQQIAACHLLPETAFVVVGEPKLRWFTPTTEVDLCGHATLAMAHVLFERGDADGEIRFETRSGALTVARHGDGYEMDFPAKEANTIRPPSGLHAALGAGLNEVLDGYFLTAVLQDEDAVRDLTPDIRAIELMHAHGVIATAPGNDVDFVSRVFVPRVGIPEDHVTGSAHCVLAPYWADRTGKKKLRARQLSLRGGDIECEVKGKRVILRGNAVTFIEGELNA
jgi:PhzF family phenazine biosynthesis protein